MIKKKNIIGICGSASSNSANLSILKTINKLLEPNCNVQLLEDLSQIPHFRTELTDENVPEEVVAFRNTITNADGVIICTPEYVFSIPSALKNMVEWSVSTTIFSKKPLALITASASGEKAHQELQLIMKTLESHFIKETTLLISGVKGKVNRDGEIQDKKTETKLIQLLHSFMDLIN